MKIACKYCGIVSKPHDCPRKPKRKNKSRYRKDVSVYNTKAYRRERENILDTYNKACLWSVYVIGETKVADEVHHIIEVLEDESKGTEPSNLIPLTSSAHCFIHDLYDCNADVKYEIQELLRLFKREYESGCYELGKYRRTVEKIIAPLGFEIF